MSSKPFSPSQGSFKEQPKTLTPLLRSSDVVTVAANWQVPDLQSVIAQESKDAFDRLVSVARADVAKELERMRDAELAQARKEGYEQGHQQGLTKGYEEGYEQGYREAKAVVDQDYESKVSAWEETRAKLEAEMTEHWQALVLSLTDSLVVFEEGLFDDVIWLTKQMAMRLLRAEMKLHPEHIQAYVRDILQQLPKVVYPLTITLNAQDIALVEAMKLDHDGRVILTPSDEFQRGECRVKSGHAEMSLTWQSLTEQLMDALLSHFSQAEHTEVSGPSLASEAVV